MLIYKIINDINNKVYIGQTTQQLKDRIHNYKKDIKNPKRSRPIIDAMKAFGFDKFHFVILEDNIKDKQVLDEREIYYIKLYKSLVTENGYNIELGGNSNGKHSEETKRKIGEAQKGELNHMYGKIGKLNATSKPILELTTDKQFESAILASNYFNVNFSHVCAVARGTRGSTGGYVFRYLDEEGNIIQPQEFVKIKSLKTRKSVLSKYQYLIY